MRKSEAARRLQDYMEGVFLDGSAPNPNYRCRIGMPFRFQTSL
jgi:hypothetical protein